MTTPQFLSESARVDEAAIQPLPASRKVYLAGTRTDIQVPFREITLSPTTTSTGVEHNPPVLVYDTSGPYTWRRWFSRSATNSISGVTMPLRA